MAKDREKLSKKDLLYNHLLALLEKGNLGWTSDVVESPGKEFVTLRTDMFWYIDGYRVTLVARYCPDFKESVDIQGYNVPVIHKPKKQVNLELAELCTASDRLYSILRHTFHLNPRWKDVK